MTLDINVMKTLKFIVRKDTRYIIYTVKHFKRILLSQSTKCWWSGTFRHQQVALNSSLLQSHYQHSFPLGT